MPTPVILDCDTGTDDAVAIMLAALHPDIELLGVTTVWGNHELNTCTDHTLRVLDHIGRADVPVAAGRAEALEPRLVPDDDRVLPPLSLPGTRLTPVSDDAVDWLVELLRATTERVTLVPTGPLTNIAAAVRADPGVVDVVDQVVLMGGAHVRGNVTPYAERNIWNDPAAAEVVMRAGFERVVMMMLDATLQASLSVSDVGELDAVGTPAATAAARFVRERIAQHGHDVRSGAAPVHDPLTVAYLLDPEVVETRPAHVSVETRDVPSYGRTAVDLGVRASSTQVALSANRGRFVDVLRRTLARCTAECSGGCGARVRPTGQRCRRPR